MTGWPVGSAPMSMYVLGSKIEGTWCALMTARRLTSGRDARVTLLVPRRDATVHICVYRRLDDAVHEVIGRSSLLILGGRRGALWPTRDERLARRLIDRGYPVVFAQVGADRETTWTASARLEELFRNSLGEPEAAAPIVSEAAEVMDTDVVKIAGCPLPDESTRHWTLAGLAFVVFLAILSIWAWATRPPSDRHVASPVAAVHHTY